MAGVFRFNSLDLNVGANAFFSLPPNSRRSGRILSLPVLRDWDRPELDLAAAINSIRVVPDSTFSPTIPDADQKCLHRGFGLQTQSSFARRGGTALLLRHAKHSE